MDNLLNDDIYLEKMVDDEISNNIEKIYNVILEYIDKKVSIHDKYIEICINTIIHIMRIILLHTRNIDCSIYYGKLSITYLLEFLSQLEVNNCNSFIPLTIQDAIIFVYKKTIFNLKKNDLHVDICKFDSIFDTVTLLVNILKYNSYVRIPQKYLNNYKNLYKKYDIIILNDISNMLILNKISIIKYYEIINYICSKNITGFNTANIYSFDYNTEFKSKHYINYLVT